MYKRQVWDIGGGQELWQAQAHSPGSCGVVFRPDGKTVTSSSKGDTKVKDWSVADGDPVMAYTHDDASAVLSLAYSPDGSILAVGTDVGADLWTPKKGNRKGAHLRSLDTAGNAVTDVSFGRGGRVLAGGDQHGTLRLWSPDGAILAAYAEHDGAISSLAFTPDGDFVVSASGTRVSWRRWAGA